MNYVGRNGTVYCTIEPPLGKGGEGAVYNLVGSSDLVAKIFSDQNRTETRRRKLLVMVNTPLSQAAMHQVTWPIDVLYENGNFAGYIMPAIKNNEELNVIYSDKYDCTLSDKIVIAKNLCAAINSVHEAGQVCGDLNPKNIVVDPKHAIITLVDTDSYHITDPKDSRVYRCDVGLPEYLPKEIQSKMINGNNLKNAQLPTFTKESDLFALAVHIFALLMNGCHPFACAVDGNYNLGRLSASQPSVVQPQPVDNILRGFFPFHSQQAGITTPKYAPAFSYLPQDIQQLFIRAFVLGSSNPSERPDAYEWYQALSIMQNNLQFCRNNARHMYPSHLGECPWCKLEATMKRVSGPKLTQTSINTIHYNAPKPQSFQPVHTPPVVIPAGTKYQPPLPPKSQHPIIDFIKKYKWWIVGIYVALWLLMSIQSCSADRAYRRYQQMINESQTNQSSVDTEENNALAEDRVLSIDPIAQNTYTCGPTEIVDYFGEIVTEGQSDDYSFTAPRDGRYRFEMSEIHDGNSVDLLIYNSLGEVVDSNYNCNNGEGVTLYDVTGGEAYRVCVRYNYAMTPYHLSIGLQKEPLDITNYTSLTDSVDFTYQCNVYYFTAPRDGRYRFEIANLYGYAEVEMLAWNDLHEEINKDYYCSNGEGLTLYDLEEGKTYEIQVRQTTGFSSYELHIGQQKETKDISSYDCVQDSIEFLNQRNVYRFCPAESGSYRFSISGMESGCDVELIAWNELGEEIGKDYYCSNGEGISLSNLSSGVVYEIQVGQSSGLTNYQLNID